MWNCCAWGVLPVWAFMFEARDGGSTKVGLSWGRVMLLYRKSHPRECRNVQVDARMTSGMMVSEQTKERVTLFEGDPGQRKSLNCSADACAESLKEEVSGDSPPSELSASADGQRVPSMHPPRPSVPRVVCFPPLVSPCCSVFAHTYTLHQSVRAVAMGRLKTR